MPVELSFLFLFGKLFNPQHLFSFFFFLKRIVIQKEFITTFRASSSFSSSCFSSIVSLSPNFCPCSSPFYYSSISCFSSYFTFKNITRIKLKVTPNLSFERLSLKIRIAMVYRIERRYNFKNIYPTNQSATLESFTQFSLSGEA